MKIAIYFSEKLILFLFHCLKNLKAVSIDLPVFKQFLEWFGSYLTWRSKGKIVYNQQTINKSHKSTVHPDHKGMMSETGDIEETEKNQMENRPTDQRNPHGNGKIRSASDDPIMPKTPVFTDDFQSFLMQRHFSVILWIIGKDGGVDIRDEFMGGFILNSLRLFRPFVIDDQLNISLDARMHW